MIKKTASYKALCGIFLVLVMISITSISLVSAWEFDNLKSYDKKTKTVEIRNSVLGIPFLQLSKVASIKLTTDCDGDGIVDLNCNVMRGEDRMVAEFEINNFNSYSNVFNKMKFYNLKKNSKKFDREFVYKYKVITIKNVGVYEEVCDSEVSTNGTEYNSCREVQKGTTTEEVEEWRVLNDRKELPEGIIRIGVFTDVKANEHVEWIPTLFGVEIEEWAEWTESLNVDIEAYWNGESNTDLVDGDNNLSVGDAQVDFASGLIGNALTFSGSQSMIIDNSDDLFQCTGNCTINMWLYKNASSPSNTIFSKTAAAYVYVLTNDAMSIQMYNGGSTVTVNPVTWTMLTIVRNDTDTIVYEDAVKSAQATKNDVAGDGTNVTLGDGTALAEGSWIGKMDEFGIWNRILSPAEITQLNNGGAGITYIDDTDPPNVTINTPTNDTFSTLVITFNVTAIDGISVDSCWYSLNAGVFNYTMSNSTGDSDNWKDTNSSMAEGGHRANFYCNDTTGRVNNSESVDFEVSPDVTFPEINISFPQNSSYTELVTRINVTYIEDYPDVCWYSNDSGVTNSSGQSCDSNFTGLTYGQGSFTIKVYINDTAGQENSSDPVTFFVDSVPPEINITTPSNYTNSTDTNLDINFIYTEANPDSCWWTEDRGVTNNSLASCSANITEKTWTEGGHTVIIYMNDTLGNENSTSVFFSIDTTAPTITFDQFGNIDYHIVNTNLTINWTVTDARLDTCILEYGGTNHSVACSDNNLTQNIATYDYRNATMFANDTLGNANTSTLTWDYYVFQNEANFSASTISGSYETFTLNFSRISSLSVSSAVFHYNSTDYSSTVADIGTETISTNSFSVPTVSADVNKTFYWNITFSDSNVVTTNSFNQSVLGFSIDNCTTNTNTIINYTLYDEETQGTLSNTTLEVQVNLYDITRENRILNFSNIYTELNPVAICLNVPLLNNTNYSLDSVAKYTSNDSGNAYATEYYHILNYTLSNTTIPGAVSLYDLKSADSTDFQLTFKDASLSLAPNVLVNVYRQYLSDNDFKIVEIPLTDSNGQTVLHLVRNDVVYNFVMKDIEGNVLGVFNSLIAFCQDFTIGDCTIDLDAVSGATTLYDRDTDLGISYSTSYSNSTELISFTYVSNDLSTKTVDLVVIRNNDFGNRTVCSESLTAASGTINCNVSSVNDVDRFLFLQVSIGGNQKVLETIDLQNVTSSFDIITGSFFAFLLILFLITMFMEDKEMLIVAIVFGWIICITFGFIKGTLFGLGSSGIWLIITAFIFLKKLREERT